LHLIDLLRSGDPRLRYLVGKGGILAFLKKQTPRLQLVEVQSGPPELRLRVRAAPGDAPPPPTRVLSILHEKVAAKVRQKLRKDCDKKNRKEMPFRALFGCLKRSVFKRMLAVASDPELYRQASDVSLDNRCVEPWSESWQVSVAMRHLHAFLMSAPQFEVLGPTAGRIPTIDELCNLRVKEVVAAEAHSADKVADEVGVGIDAHTQPKAEDVRIENSSEILEGSRGQKVVLQVLSGEWLETEGNAPEVRKVIVERAWLVKGGQVIEPLADHVTASDYRKPIGVFWTSG